MNDPLLSLQDLVKDYAVRVLDVSRLEFRSGQIHALLGANGAGKSTLSRIIAGLLLPTSGSMTLDGHTFAPENKLAAEAAGVQIVQQELNQISTLTVAENILLGRLPTKFGVIDRTELDRRARIALDRFGLEDISTDTVTGTMGIGRQQMIEIAAALDRECKMLILDEPTASLSAGESEKLFDWLDRLRKRGVAIIYITHRLEEVVRIADRVTVLRDGRHALTCPISEITVDELVDAMTGETGQSESRSDHPSFATCEPALKVVGMSRGRFVRDVSFTVHRGERLGIAGLVGSGRTELLRLLFGADRAERGDVFLSNDPSPRRFRNPAEAVAAGLAMVTEDRKESGLLLPLSIRVNATLASMTKQFSWFGLIRSGDERDVAERTRELMEIRCNSIGQPLETLSGGNQQKVAIAKWLVHDANIFFFDEPTRGIDVSSRRRIYKLFDQLAADGKAIVIVSSDLEELIQTCDRIAVMSVGRWVGEFERDQWSAEKIMQAAFSNPVSLHETVPSF